MPVLVSGGLPDAWDGP